MFFPITCVDNFFQDPDAVRELALSLPYDKKEGNYPGVRTKPLHEIAPDYFQFFCRRLFGLFYDYRKFNNVDWVVSTTFQKIEPFEGSDAANVGWIHKDKTCLFAGIIYLTPNANPDSGTSIFKPKKVNCVPINILERNEMFATNKGDERTEKALKENNERFIETVRFQNMYNRLVSYGGENYHGVNSYCTKTEPRLTQVFFVKNVIADWYPRTHLDLI